MLSLTCFWIFALKWWNISKKLVEKREDLPCTSVRVCFDLNDFVWNPCSECSVLLKGTVMSFPPLYSNGIYCVQARYMYICKNVYIKNRYQTNSFFWRDVSSISHFWFNVSDYSLITVNKASEYIMVGFFFSQSYWFCSYWISSQVFPVMMSDQM